MRKLCQLLSLLVLVATLSSSAAAQTMISVDSTAALSQGFGQVVAVGDGEVIVGEPRNLFRSGIVYVFRKDDGAWVEQAQLTAAEPALQDRFGRSIAIDGRTMLIGGDPQGPETPGTVRVFSRDVMGSWSEVQQLVPTDGSIDDSFGTTLLLRADLALVGAPNVDSTGAVYVFMHNGDEWLQTGKLVASDAATGDAFGTALSVSGDHMLIGAPGRGDGAGAVFHFHGGDGQWTELGTLPRRVESENGRFGSSLATAGEDAYVGVPGANSRVGGVSVYSFDPDGMAWREGVSLTPFDGGRRAAFGSALATIRGGIWVGTPGGRTVFEFASGGDGFSSATKITPEDPGDARSFGGAIAVNGELAAVGISGGDNGGGNARVFEWIDGTWVPSSLLASAREGLPAITGERINCSDEGHVEGWDCRDVDLVSFLPVGEMGGGRGIWLNDIWGWTDEETGREFAIVGRIDAAAFIEVSDPSHPRYLGELPRTEGARTSAWRDIKVYRNHAYIVSDGAGEHGMQVVDLTQLRDIGDEPITLTEAFHYDEVASAHNIVINEGTGFAYIVGASGGGTTCGGGLHMVDIRDPGHPVFAGCFADAETGRRGTGYSHDAQCINYTGPDEDYQGKEICIGANETALSFSDVSDKENPLPISSVSYPNVAYAHQGWLTDDQRYFFSNDEGDEGQGTVEGTRTLIWDVADLDDPILLGEYIAETTDTDHNLYIKGNYMYQSNYGAGLRILDISDPTNPVEVGYFDMQPDDAACCASWSNYPYFKSGIIAVTGWNAGVFFLQKREELVP